MFGCLERKAKEILPDVYKNSFACVKQEMFSKSFKDICKQILIFKESLLICICKQILIFKESLVMFARLERKAKESLPDVLEFRS